MNIQKWPDPDFEEKSGVYFLCLGKPLLKFSGEDPLGVLYVGKATKTFKRRFGVSRHPTWRKRYNKNSDWCFDHSLLFYAVDFRPVEEDGKEDLEHLILRNYMEMPDNDYVLIGQSVFILMIKTDESAKEGEYLAGHLMKYGSLPPFNSTGASIKRCSEMKEKDKKKCSKFFSDAQEELRAYLQDEGLLKN